MRFKIFIAAFAICLAPNAHAQDTPIYFVVDASGSMKDDNKKDAEELLRGLSLPRGQQISVTYFGGKPSDPNADLCFENLVVPDLAPRESNLPSFPDLGGPNDKTAILRALELVLGAARGPAKFVLITDGAEECRTDFGEIRKRYPEAEIVVRQVGLTPNTDLQAIENKPLQPASTSDSIAVKPIASPWLPFPVPGTFKREPKMVDHWAEANWWEKYLWVIAYACVAGSAWFLGARFGKMSIRVERAIAELEQALRKKVQPDGQKSIETEDDLPPELSDAEVAAEGKGEKVWSASLFLFALVTGLPLAFSDGIEQLPVAVFAMLSVALLALWLTLKAPTKPSVETESLVSSAARESYLPSALHGRIALAAGLLAATASTLLFGNLDKARDAAWVVLSSGFSGALAVVASAPLLFLGARRWSFEQAKFTYHRVTTEAISAKLRAQREAAKKTKLDWDNFRTQISKWSFPSSNFVGWWFSALRISAAEKARSAVIAKAKAMAVKAGGDKPTAEANAVYNKLLEQNTLAGFIRVLMSTGLMNGQEELWRSLADALDSGKGKRMAEAFLKLA